MYCQKRILKKLVNNVSQWKHIGYLHKFKYSLFPKNLVPNSFTGFKLPSLKSFLIWQYSLYRMHHLKLD